MGQGGEIGPAGLKSRLRGFQTHKARLNTATPGSRVAANLVGIATSQLQRGDVLTNPGWLIPTRLLTMRLRLLPHLRRPLRHNATVSFHTGAMEMMAKVRLLEKEELQPGEVTWAQLSLSKPVAIVHGDHFIIRSSVETLGGGEVIESHPKRYRRFRPAVIQSLRVREEGTAEEIVIALLEAKQPLELPDLLAQCNLSASDVHSVLESLIQQGKVVGIGQKEHRLLLTRPGWERLAEKTIAIVQDYHRRFPVRLGMPKVELSSKLRRGAHSSAILQRLLDEGLLHEDGLAVRLPTHQIQLTPAQQTKIDTFLDSLARDPYSPPSDQIPEPDLLNLLIERHQVVKVDNKVVFSTSTYDEMVARVIAHIKAQGKVTLAEVRDMFNTSRKYALAFLEHLDEKRITRRAGDERVLGRGR